MEKEARQSADLPHAANHRPAAGRKNETDMDNNKVREEYAKCPIRNVISNFGDKWSLLVLYHLHKSGTEAMRFGEIHRQMADCSQKMLTQTLKNLERQQLVSRKVYPEVPPKVEYSLTSRGQSLVPIIDDLIAWAQQNYFADSVTF